MTGPAPHRIGYLGTPDLDAGEDRAARVWLRAEEAFTLHSLALPLRLPASLDVVWIHGSDPKGTLSEETHGTLRRYVEAGGGLLLTGAAARLPHALGVEDQPPQVRLRKIVDEGFGRPCGFQSFRGHPVLDAFHGGLFLWYPDEDRTEQRVGYFDDTWPVQGRVVGIEKTYITLHPDARLLIEHKPGTGRILSAGAFIHLAPMNHHALHTRHFLRHALHYLVRPAIGQLATYWTPTANQSTQVAIPPSEPATVDPRKPFDHPSPRLALTRATATDAFFDVAGRRCLMMGTERGGLVEVWIYPVRVLRDLEIGLVSNGDVRWLHDLPTRVETRPEAFIRTYDLPNGTLKETIVAALDAPGGVVRLTASVAEPLVVILRFRSDLRWMWPYAEGALGALRFGYDAGLHALHVHDPSGDVYALIGADQAPDDQLGGAFAGIDWTDDGFRGIPTDAHQIYQAFRYTLGPANGYTLHLAIAGTNQGRNEAEQTFRRLLDNSGAVYEEAARHYRDLLETSTTLATPDPSFDEGYRWAVVGTDRFKATTPGLGAGLLAGYATADKGWNGGHAVSGRPGYAWYFGRDAQWAGFAVDGYGDVATVRQQLLLFCDFQDLSGKIFHELPLSGVAHYDAADATPLYVVLAAHYVRASGDLNTLRALWPSLRRAMAFLYTTDTDGDGLIENTNVGHGWIEGGALYGAHVTLYLAGVWARALRDAAYLAALLDDKEAARYARDARRVVAAIERDFWNADTGFYHYGLRRDGTFIPEPTVLPAVLMHFRLLDPSRATTMLDAYASNAFSTDWGVRILSAESPRFNPEGYHYGSVWPLFTGWAALAAYAYGRPSQGFTHAMQNLLPYRHDALGWIPEVLHGQHYRVQRVCPHQCWSETNVLHPIVAGLVGFHPDAPHQRLRLEPHVPLHWNTFQVDNLRLGATRLRLTMRREARRTIYRLTRTAGPDMTVHFAPEIPHAMHVRAVLLNGVAQPPGRRSLLGLLDPPLVFYLNDEAIIDLRHSGGLGVVPHLLRPQPGDASQGSRIIRDGIDGDAYVVTAEGPAATIGRFQIRHFDRAVARIDGADAAETTEDGLLTWAVSFPQSDGPWSRTTVRFYLA